MVEPLSNADPYHGLCASTYDALVPADAVGDVEFFRAIIAAGGEPALEIASGTGRLLVPYTVAGLDVEGVDSSAEMIEICRSKAAASGVEVTLHRQAMQELELKRRFRTIYVPYFTFQLLTDDADVDAALAGFYAHLEPGGELVLPLFFPMDADVGQDAAPADEWRLRRESVGETESIRCWENASYDLDAQVKRSRLRFEVIDEQGEVVEREDRELGIRWYTQEQMTTHLRTAGFRNLRIFRGHSDAPAGPQDASFTFRAIR